MLYPTMQDLMTFKNKKSQVHTPRHSVTSTAPGNHHSPFRGHGLEFDSVREYVPGDDIRRIDWRVTARTGRPHLKLFKEERERPIIICVDMNGTMRFGTRKTFKSIQAARVAALLGWQAIAHQDRVGGCLFGDLPGAILPFPPQRSRSSFAAILQMLSTPPEEHHNVSFDAAIDHLNAIALPGSLIYFISDFMAIEDSFHQQNHLSRLLKRSDAIFISVNDQADRELSPVGVVAFSSHTTERVYVNTDSASGREAYASQWRQRRQRLYDLTSHWKIPLLELTTESDVYRDLLIGLNSIAKRKRR